VDELTNDLKRRFSLTKPTAVRYERDGLFSITVNGDLLESHDRQARTAMQEIPQLQGLNLVEAEPREASEPPVTVNYTRSATSVSEVQAVGLDKIGPQKRVVVRDVRMGLMPSIVLDSGMRYFEGALLPDGSVLSKISADSLLVQRGKGEVKIPLGVGSGGVPEAPSSGVSKRQQITANTR
jgi:hypothetical protein